MGQATLNARTTMWLVRAAALVAIVLIGRMLLPELAIAEPPPPEAESVTAIDSKAVRDRGMALAVSTEYLSGLLADAAGAVESATASEIDIPNEVSIWPATSIRGWHVKFASAAVTFPGAKDSVNRDIDVWLESAGGVTLHPPATVGTGRGGSRPVAL